MSSSESNRRTLDRKLRAVNLPEGLIARLREVATADDEGLDAAIRELPQPEGLLGRLRAVAVAEDADLDAALCEVAVPPGLVKRLRSGLLADDDALDEAIRCVPVPLKKLEQFKRKEATPSPRRRQKSPLQRMAQTALAASLLIAVGLTAMSGILAYMASRSGTRVPLPQLAQHPGPGKGEGIDKLDFTSPLNDAPAVQPRRSADALAGTHIPTPSAELLAAAPPSAFDQAMGLFASNNADPLLDATPYRWGSGVLASQNEVDSLPDLKRVAGPTPLGIRPPVVTGFDLAYFNKYHIFPFVSPSAHPKLVSSIVPLGIDTASYELARRYVEDGQLPPTDRVRPEEFYNAIDYEYPSPKREIGISSMGGPSIFGGPGLTMLQVGVQAQRPGDEKHAPAHLVLAVDVSASMSWGGRIDMVRRALGNLIARMGPDDRVSMVAFSEDAATVFEDINRYEADQFLRAVAELTIRSSTNVGAGLRQAFTVARHFANSGLPVRVVLVTDGAVEFDADAVKLIETRLADSARSVRLDVIDLGQGADPDRHLQDFARIGGGKAFRAGNADQIGWSLMEILTGAPQIVGRDVRLKITFNPKTVLAYRLIGHEPAALAGLVPEHPEADFHKGQSGTALYELRLTTGGDQEIATVQVTWYVPQGGDQRTIVHHVTRKDFSPTFEGENPSLQASTLVARTAELLRNPPAPLGDRSLPNLARAVKKVDASLALRPSYAEFVTLVERAAKAKPARSGGR